MWRENFWQLRLFTLISIIVFPFKTPDIFPLGYFPQKCCCGNSLPFSCLSAGLLPSLLRLLQRHVHLGCYAVTLRGSVTVQVLSFSWMASLNVFLFGHNLNLIFSNSWILTNYHSTQDPRFLLFICVGFLF